MNLPNFASRSHRLRASLLGIRGIICALAILVLVGGTGCSTQKNLTQLVKALAHDPATVNIRVTSIYGTITFTRTAPTTNSLPHSINPDGTVSVGKQ